jgi:hypothetical protein
MPDVRIAICLHETHCLPRQLGLKGPVLSPWQRHTVAGVTRLGDVIFTAVAPYYQQAIEEYQVAPGRVFRLPIGSNIPPASLTPQDRAELRNRLGWQDNETVAVVFGSYPTQLRALQQFEQVIRNGMQQGFLHRLICLGGDQRDSAQQIKDWGAACSPSGKFEVLGPRPAPDVGRILACCDFALTPTPRHLLEKSGAFIAYAFAGLAVLVNTAPSERSSSVDDLPVVPAESWEWQRASSPEVAGIRIALKNHAHANYTWNSIAQRALTHLAETRILRVR